MQIVIDAGNTRLKWARLERGEVAAGGHAVHRGDADRAFKELERALPARVSRALVANVAGAEIASRLQALLARHSGIAPEFVATSAERFGVRCAYEDPSRLGVDRWVGVLAAHRRAGRAACVVSAGTAVTFDAVDADGRHLGGLILAGRDLQAAALARWTADIGVTRADAQAPRGLELLGRNTDDAVGRGAWLALGAAVDRAVATVAAALGVRPVVYLTGGDGPALGPWLETAVELRGDLVLEGLALFAAEPPSRAHA